MKCPKCEGTGEIQICEMGFIGKDECDKCHGKGYLNNEEWFDTLTTKGKAEVIAQLSSYGGNVDAILGWLKEKHDGSM